MTFDLEVKNNFVERMKQTDACYQYFLTNGLLKPEGASLDASTVARLFGTPYMDENGMECSKWRTKFDQLSDIFLSEGLYIRSSQGAIYLLSGEESLERNLRRRILNAQSEFRCAYQSASYPFKHTLSEEARKKYDALQKSAARSSLIMQEELLKSFSI